MPDDSTKKYVKLQARQVRDSSQWSADTDRVVYREGEFRQDDRLPSASIAKSS